MFRAQAEDYLGFGHALGEVAGEQGYGVVAALAVAGELDSLRINKQVDVLEVPRGAKAVGMNRLAPLVVGLVVAVSAVFSRVERLGAEELAVRGDGIRGQERRLLAEGVVVAAEDETVKPRGGARSLEGGMPDR
jgi:hypothetical protein